MAAVVRVANDQFHNPLSAKFSILKIVPISVPSDLISNPAALFDVICGFGRTIVFALVDRWFGVYENEGLSTIWKKQIVTVETHDVHGSDLQQPSIVPMPLLIQGVGKSTKLQLLYENLKVFHFRQGMVSLDATRCVKVWVRGSHDEKAALFKARAGRKCSKFFEQSLKQTRLLLTKKKCTVSSISTIHWSACVATCFQSSQGFIPKNWQICLSKSLLDFLGFFFFFPRSFFRVSLWPGLFHWSVSRLPGFLRSGLEGQ